VLTGAERGSRLLVVEKGRGGDVDELNVWHREQHLRAFHIRKTEPRGAGERRFATRAGDAPQRGPRHLRELLRSEHGEATEAEDADADRVHLDLAFLLAIDVSRVHEGSYPPRAPATHASRVGTRDCPPRSEPTPRLGRRRP